MSTSRKIFMVNQWAFVLGLFSLMLNLIVGDIFLLFWAGFFCIQFMSLLFMLEEQKKEKKAYMNFLKNKRKK